MSARQNHTNTVTVHILDREYQVSCPPDEQDALLRSARYLDENMRQIKARGNIHGLDKISVMAALNITHELLQAREELEALREHDSKRVQSLKDKIDRALENNRQIEL